MSRRRANEQLFHVAQSAVLVHTHELLPPTIPIFPRSIEEGTKGMRRGNGSAISQTFESTSHHSHSPIPHLDAIPGPPLASEIGRSLSRWRMRSSTDPSGDGEMHHRGAERQDGDYQVREARESPERGLMRESRKTASVKEIGGESRIRSKGRRQIKRRC
jgi:hypothetical protein